MTATLLLPASIWLEFPQMNRETAKVSTAAGAFGNASRLTGEKKVATDEKAHNIPDLHKAMAGRKPI